MNRFLIWLDPRHDSFGNPTRIADLNDGDLVEYRRHLIAVIPDRSAETAAWLGLRFAFSGATETC